MTATTSPPPARPVTPHSILSHRIDELLQRMEREGAQPEHRAELARCQALAAPLEDYLLQVSTPPSAALEALEERTRRTDWTGAYADGQANLELEQEMVSGKLEGQFLKMLVAIAGARRILEIGSFTGYASLAMAEALPPGGELIACEYDAFAADIAAEQLRRSPAGKRVTIRVGDANATLRELAQAGTPFDLVFIDADKEGYLGYYRFLLENDLVPVGGLLCIDNTLFQGQVYAEDIPTTNGRALADFNRAVANDARVEQVLLPLRDGLTLARRIH